MSGSTRKTNDKDYMLDVLKKVRPDIPAYEEDGSIFTRDAYTENPYTTLRNTLMGNGLTFNGTGYLEYTIIDGLFARTSYTTNYVDSESLTYRWRGSTFNYDGARQWSNAMTPTMVWENTMNFAKTYGKHDVIAMAGYSRERTKTTTYGMNASNFPDDEVLNNFSSAATRGAMSESIQEHALISQFARAHYKFNNKYIVSGTIRRDGSSRFGPDKRWGVFPSFAGAWLISEEGFMKNEAVRKYVTYLKLRASTGRAGSQNLGNYAWRTNVGASRYNENPAIVPSSIGNTELQWEQTTMTDVGIDFGLWNERIRGSFGVYRKETEDLIYSNPLPPSSAFTSISRNIASTQNDGIEFEIKFDAIHTTDLLFTLDFNAASNVTKVLKINNVLEELEFGGVMKLEAGERTGQWYGYQYAGRLYVNQEDLIAMQGQLPTGAVQYFGNNLENYGDLMYVDQNGDGKLTAADDRIYLGTAEPKVFGGFGATALYKNIMLNAIFTYAYGHMRLWQMPRADVGYGGNYNHTQMTAGRSADMVGPYEADYPRLRAGYGRGFNSQMSDFWLHDASYIRLNALNLSYRLPDKLFREMLIDAIELTFQATNLFTLTKYPGFDPQGNWSSTSIGNGMGMDGSNYPSAKVFNFGLKVTLK
jgi:TonB-dependent starch-binding outer membrane protein SusC